VWRVLKADGTCWVNLGDSYTAGGQNSGSTPDQLTQKQRSNAGCRYERRVAPEGLNPKNLVGIPWRVAFALQADGWYLRQDIIWSKPNPMPESVTDRCTKAHEYLFLLAKSERYYYDAKAIAEDSTYAGKVVTLSVKSLSRGQANGANVQPSGNALKDSVVVTARRNKRSVWTIPTMPYAGAHFATMPEALVAPCILAGCPVGGLVLDPFLGSGTVGVVAERLGRRWVGTDLGYQPLAQARTVQLGIRW